MMPESPAPAPETETQTPAPEAATTAPAAPPADASPPPADQGAKADPAASPTAPMDVHAELMKVATAAIQKPDRGEPSPSDSQGKGNAEVPPKDIPAKPKVAAEVPAAAAAAVKAKPDQKTDDLDESKPPPFHDHPRWKKLTRDFQETAAERDQLKAPAEQYGKIIDYMRQFDINTDDMVVAYDLIARIKHDPISAFEKLTPIYNDLAKRAGKVLPDDLQKRVDEGYMDEESARELAQTRVREKLAQDQTARERRTVDQTQASVAIERNRAAANTWENQIIAKDPDFERKRPAVQDAAKAIIAAEGQPRTPEKAWEVLERAYKRVNDMLVGYAPQRSATPPKPNGAASPSTAAVTVPPKSLLEAAQQGLEGRYRFNS